MASVRVSVGPVYETTQVIPLILAINHHWGTEIQVIYSRRNIDVVGNKHGLPILFPNDESLMPITHVVVSEESDNFSLMFFHTGWLPTDQWILDTELPEHIVQNSEMYWLQR